MQDNSCLPKTIGDTMIGTMAKKKETAKETLYVEMPAELKQRLAALAERRSRKISAEAIIAIREYVEREEGKEGGK